MPRGKNTNVYLVCQEAVSKDKKCGMQNYKTRINKKTITGKLEHKKFCAKCNKSTLHASGSEIKHSS
ncbi:50S ribosomal protein L33 [Patescibacteria group bacterium]|nr:50S ribosomal protein L33 [Patescibacteria group bacterium]MBU1683503.1 50S ribosomal protein L33 [Patescibacteria group bacterium]